jgi:hypothetical protein
MLKMTIESTIVALLVPLGISHGYEVCSVP